MFCCKDCPLQAQSTLTTVLFMDQMSQMQTYKLSQYAQKNLRKMHAKTFRQDHPPHHENPMDYISAKVNKENTRPNTNQAFDVAAKTKRRSSFQEQARQRVAAERDCETGRFKGSESGLMRNSQTKRGLESQYKRGMESKTTSFGSLASRKSNPQSFWSKDAVLHLQDQLEALREEEMYLLREKLQKKHLYKRELLKIENLKDKLKVESGERQSDIQELKQILLKKRQGRN